MSSLKSKFSLCLSAEGMHKKICLASGNGNLLLWQPVQHSIRAGLSVQNNPLKKTDGACLERSGGISRVIQLQGASKEITKEEMGRAASILTCSQTHIFHTPIFYPPFPVSKRLHHKLI